MVLPKTRIGLVHVYMNPSQMSYPENKTISTVMVAKGCIGAADGVESIDSGQVLACSSKNFLYRMLYNDTY